MSRMMGFLPMPLEGMMEFHENEMARIEALPQSERYSELASISRVRELTNAVNEGYSTPAMRAELEYRFVNDPYFQNMVEAGRQELPRHFDTLVDEDTPAILREPLTASENFMMTADIATLARMDVMDMHYHGLKARAEAHGDLSAEEADFVAQMDNLQYMNLMVNPAAEVGEMILNPETASVEASDMKAGFEDFAGVINAILHQPEALAEMAEKVGGTANALNAASARSIMNNGFTAAASDVQGGKTPHADNVQPTAAPAPGM